MHISPRELRRRFFRLGAATFVGVAVLAACGGEVDDGGPANTGEEDPGPPEDTTTGTDGVTTG